MSNTGKLLTGFLSGVNDALKYKIETDRKHKEDEYNYNTQRNRDINAFKEANELGLYKTDRKNRPDVERANAYLKALGAGSISYEPTPKEFQLDAADVALKKHNDLIKLGVPEKEARAIAYGYKGDTPKDTRTTNQKDFEYYNKLSPEQRALWDRKYGKSAAVKTDDSSPSVKDFKDLRDALDKAYGRHREISKEYAAAMSDQQVADFIKLYEQYEATEDENIRKQLDAMSVNMPRAKMAQVNRLLSELTETESTMNRLASLLPEYNGYKFHRSRNGGLGGWLSPQDADMTARTSAWQSVIDGINTSETDKANLPQPIVLPPTQPQQNPTNPIINPNLGGTFLERSVKDFENKRKLGVATGSVIQG